MLSLRLAAALSQPCATIILHDSGAMPHFGAAGIWSTHMKLARRSEPRTEGTSVKRRRAGGWQRLGTGCTLLIVLLAGGCRSGKDGDPVIPFMPRMEPQPT